MLAHSKRVAALVSQVVTLLRPEQRGLRCIYWTMRGRPREEPFIWLTLLMHFFGGR